MKALCFAIALSLFGGGAIAQSSIDLTLSQARDLATQALFSDDPAIALQIAEAILAELPDDRLSLLTVAAAAPRLGEHARGRAAGARAWSVATTDIQKYEAARLTALAAANEARYTLATFWLRRALTVAPNDAERTRTLNDARRLSRLNPWSTSLSFSLSPSSNVNGGAEDEDFVIAGRDTGLNITATDLALKGWRASFSANTQYRLHEDAQSRSIVGLGYRGARGRFLEDTELPDAALRTDALTLSLRNDLALENGSISATLSQAIFRYQTYDTSADETNLENYKTLGVKLERQLSLSDNTSVSFSLGQERVDFTDGDRRIDRTTLGTALAYQRDSRDRVNLSLGFVDANGDNTRNTSRDHTISMSYRWAEPIGPVSLSMGAGFTYRIFPDFEEFDFTAGFAAVDGGRKDQTAFANMNIGFPQVSYAGFSPGVRIDAARTRSNVSRYERTTFSAAFTISSQF